MTTQPQLDRTANDLDQEISALRGAMRLITDHLSTLNDLPKLTFHATALCRLADSITRALLANIKLNTINQEAAQLKAEVRRMFNELGYNQHP